MRAEYGRRSLVLGHEFRGEPPTRAYSVEKLPGVATAIAGGNSHRCAVVDGDVYCWGNNFSGRFWEATVSTPMALSRLKGWRGPRR